MTPQKVKTYNDTLKLKRDNVDCGDAWIILNGASQVLIHNQKVGEKSTGAVRLSRRQMNRFVKWWLEGK